MAELNELEQMVVGDGSDMPEDADQFSEQQLQEDAAIEEEFGSQEAVSEEEQQEITQVEEVTVESPNTQGQDTMSAYDKYQLDTYLSADYIDPDFIEYNLPETGDSLIAASFRQNNAAYRLTKQAASNYLTNNNDIDANFDITKEYAKYENEFPTSREQRYLADANNMQNFFYRVGQLRQDKRDILTISQSGTVGGFTAGALSSIIDIDMFVPQMAVSGLVSKSAKAANLSRKLSNVGTGAATGIVANTVTGLGLAKTNPNYTEGDLVADILLGGALGGVFGSLQKGHYTPEQLEQIPGIKFDEQGRMDIKDLDSMVENYKVEYNRLTQGIDHSIDTTMPYSSADSLARAYAFDKQLTKRLAAPNITRKEMNNIARDIRVEYGADFRMTKADKKRLIAESRSRAEQGVDEAKFFDEIYNKSEVYRTKFAKKGELSPAMSKFMRGDQEFNVKEEVPEGVKVTDEVTAEDTAKVATPGEPVLMEQKELDVVNKTLRSNYRKGIVQLESLEYTSDGNAKVKIRTKAGKIIEYSDPKESKALLNNLRDMVLTDYSAGIARTTHDTRKLVNKKLDDILKHVPEIYTDFKKIANQDYSITLQKFSDDMLVSALGNNIIGGQSVHSIKEGVLTELSHGYSLLRDAMHQRTNQILADTDRKNIIINNDIITIDKRAEVEAFREVTRLQNDLDMQNSDTMIKLGNDLNQIIDKYYDLGGKLIKDKRFNQEVKALAEKYNNKYDVNTLRALIGQNILGRKSVDMMQDVPREAIRAKGVEGAEDLEHGWYQPQYASSEKITNLREEGFTEESVIDAMAHMYYRGIQQKNPTMSDDVAQELARLTAKGSVGRVWMGIDDRSTAIAGRTAFADDLVKFINNNESLSPELKGNLRDMEQSLRADQLESTFLKERVPFDRSATFKITNKDGTVREIDGMDLMKTPDYNTWMMYMNRTAGEVSLAAKGWDRRAILDNRALIKRELVEAGATDYERNLFLDMYDATMAVVQSQPNPQSTKMGNWQKVNTLKRLFNLNVLGGLGVSQLAEFVTVAGNVGIINAVKRLGIDKVTKQGRAKAGRDAAFMEELMTSQRVIEEMESVSFSDLEEMGKANFGQRFDRALTVTEDVHRKVTLMEPIRSFQRTMAWNTTMDLIVQQLDKTGWKLNDRLKNLGVDEDFVRILSRELEIGRMYRDRGVVRMNYQDMDLGEVFSRNDRIKLSGVIRSVEKNEKLLRPQAGASDFRLANPMVGIFTHLKTYPLFSVNSVFMKQLRYADRHTAGVFLTAGMLSIMATYLKAYSYGYDTDDIQAMDAFMKYNSTLGGVGMGIDAVANILNIPSLRISPDYGRNNSAQIPVRGYLENLLGLGALPVDILEDGDLSSESMNTIKKTIPGMYNIWTAALINNYIDAVKEEENTIKAQERKQNRPSPMRLGDSPEEAKKKAEAKSPEAEAVEVLDSVQLGN